MRNSAIPRVLCLACVAAISLGAAAAFADEIRLKDGKKLYGVIVAYEDNMFKVKTDYGYVLVEKDKIKEIVPNSPAGADPKAAAQPAKSEPAAGSATTPSATTPAAAEVSAKSKIPNTNARPALPSTSADTTTAAPNMKTPVPVATNAMANLAEAIQGLVHHMRTEQQMIRDWVDSQAEQHREVRRLLEILARERVDK